MTRAAALRQSSLGHAAVKQRSRRCICPSVRRGGSINYRFSKMSASCLPCQSLIASLPKRRLLLRVQAESRNHHNSTLDACWTEAVLMSDRCAVLGWARMSGSRSRCIIPQNAQLTP